MDFKEKYTTKEEKEKPENKNKKVISDDAFALGEVIISLIRSIERVRLNLLVK